VLPQNSRRLRVRDAPDAVKVDRFLLTSRRLLPPAPACRSRRSGVAAGPRAFHLLARVAVQQQLLDDVG